MSISREASELVFATMNLKVHAQSRIVVILHGHRDSGVMRIAHRAKKRVS